MSRVYSVVSFVLTSGLFNSSAFRISDQLIELATIGRTVLTHGSSVSFIAFCQLYHLSPVYIHNIGTTAIYQRIASEFVVFCLPLTAAFCLVNAEQG